jgi:transcriptional regulator with XRE-family HTH domain
MATKRVCSVCRSTLLSRFNSDDVCASCTVAARDLENVGSTWLWDSQPMRDALARRDLSAAMVIFRASSGLSQQDLADVMGWSQSKVCLIERGQRDTLFDIRELLRFADMVNMPRWALVPLLLGNPDATLAGDLENHGNSGVGDIVDRRRFNGFVAGAAAALAIPVGAIPARVTKAHARYLRTCADSWYTRDQVVGGAALLAQAMRQWRQARRMLDESSYTEQTGRELMNATGELAICVGWLSYDGGDQQAARRLYSEALLLANQADDQSLAAHVLEKMSLQSAHLAREGNRGQAREAIRLSTRAADLVRRDPTPRLHSLIAARQAIAYAALGDGQGFKTAMTRAWRELDRGWSVDDPVWLQFVVPAEITIHEAKGQAYLGNHNCAVALYRRSLDDPDLSRRNRACYQAQFAAALANSGDAATAISEGLSVLPMLEQDLASPRIVLELRPVRSSAGQLGAKEFCERFDNVAQSAA